MKIEVENMSPNKGSNESIYAFFDLGVYDSDGRPIMVINGSFIVPDYTPTDDGSQRLAVKFPFLNKSFQRDQVKHLVFFIDTDLKKQIIIDAISQYRARIEPLLEEEYEEDED